MLLLVLPYLRWCKYLRKMWSFMGKNSAVDLSDDRRGKFQLGQQADTRGDSGEVGKKICELNAHQGEGQQEMNSIRE